MSGGVFHSLIVASLALAAGLVNMWAGSVAALGVLAVGVSWLLPNPWFYIALLALGSEFWSIEPLGIAAGAVIVPALIRHAMKYPAPEVTGVYLAGIGGSAAALMGWLMVPEVVRMVLADRLALGGLPWQRWLWDWLLISGSVALVLVWMAAYGPRGSTARPYVIQSWRR